MFNSIAQQLPPQELHHMVKLMQSWRRETILPHTQLDNLEAIIPGLAAAGAAAGAGVAGADVGYYEGSDTAGGMTLQQQLAAQLVADGGAGGSGSKGSAASPAVQQQAVHSSLTPAKRVSPQLP